MKKLFLLLLLFFTTDSLASGIASNTNSAPCTNNTLETYSGNSNLAADWQPNEIQLRWYNNNTLMDVQSAANTCIYDGTLAVPQTAPTRTGYTFAGWTVRPEMDFGTISTSDTYISNYAKGDGWCGYRENGISYESGCSKYSSIAEFADLQYKEWKVIYEHGTVYGMAMCSKRPGENYGFTFPQQHKSDWQESSAETLENYTGGNASSEAKNCWCKATGYQLSNQSVKYGPSKRLDFVFDSYTGNVDCLSVCALRWRRK